jgi:dynein heavy chain
VLHKRIPKYFQVSEKIPLTKLDEKYDRVLKYCEREVDHIYRLFRKQKEDPPLSRNFPPIAGKRKNAVL